MKPLLFLIIPAFFSCGKDNLNSYSFPSASSPASAQTPLKTALMAHTWRLDSTGSASVYDKTVYGYPRQTLAFTINKYSYGFENATGTDSVNYEQDGPNKIYYWSADGTKNPSYYFLVESVTDTSLTMLFPNDDNKREWFHTK